MIPPSAEAPIKQLKINDLGILSTTLPTHL